MRRIDHVAIVVDDTVGAAHWYSENYGAKIEYCDESWSLVSFSNIKLAFVLKSDHPPHIAFEDPFLESGNEHRDGSISAYKEDPWSNVIEIVNYRKERNEKS